jgi:hypothetical protein
VTGALETSNIKTIHLVLRTIDTEKGRQEETDVDPYILTLSSEFALVGAQKLPDGGCATKIR